MRFPNKQLLVCFVIPCDCCVARLGVARGLRPTSSPKPHPTNAIPQLKEEAADLAAKVSIGAGRTAARGRLRRSLCVAASHVGPHWMHPSPLNADSSPPLPQPSPCHPVLQPQGIVGTGQGFDAASVGRLGQFSFIPQHNPPEHRKRDVALQVGGRLAGGQGKAWECCVRIVPAWLCVRERVCVRVRVRVCVHARVYVCVFRVCTCVRVPARARACMRVC